MRCAHRALAFFVTGTLAALIGGGCSDGPTSGEPSPPAAEVTPQVELLEPTQHLVRASMTIRGIRPSIEELEAVAKEPSALPAVVDRYLASGEFGTMIRDLHDEALKVKIAPILYPAGFPARGSLAGVEAQALNDAVTDAPLRLVEHVAVNDRPYSEIVTADYTVADGVVAKVWGLDHPGDAKAWTETRYTDGREHAGILSDSFLFTRHSTTYSNANRGRANAVSSALLCYDFLSRDISVDASINLADPEEVAHATQKNAACASCHQTLDPLAAYFAGFRPQYVPSFEPEYPIVFNTAPLAGVYSKAEPAYFGHEGRGLRFLGSMIAQDPRFSLCAAKRFYAYMNQVPLERVPIERAAEYQKIFVESGMNARKLARAIVLSDDFRAKSPVAGLPSDVLTPPGLRKVRARDLGRLLHDLTGIRWETELGSLGGGPYDPGPVGRIDLLSDPFFGYGVLFGGTDDYYVMRPSHTMNATATAVLRAAASKAASAVVDADFGEPSVEKRRLLKKASEATTEEAEIRAQLVDLHARLFGQIVPPSSDDVNASYDLFRDALAASGSDAKRAWTVTLFAMLQDVRLVFY